MNAYLYYNGNLCSTMSISGLPRFVTAPRMARMDAKFYESDSSLPEPFEPYPEMEITKFTLDSVIDGNAQYHHWDVINWEGDE